MKSSGSSFGAAVLLFLAGQVFANSAPVVSNVSSQQRNDDSKLVDIYYNLADIDGDLCTVWVTASNNGGQTWRVNVFTLSGAWGPNIAPGVNKHILWDAGADLPGNIGDFKIRVYADDGKRTDDMVTVPSGMFPYQGGTWVFVDTFLIDKYEVTNQKYCQFLNNSDPNGAYYSSSMEIVRSGDPGFYEYTVYPDKENYPIRYVSRYDCDAYAQWRSNLEGKSYRLPTEGEWEKAAGWDPTLEKLWTYGFQRDTIGSTWCNYNNYYGGPLPVGSFNGTDGKNNAYSYYGCYDMSGNIREWTSSNYVRGGYWDVNATYCSVTNRRSYFTPSTRNYGIGFRLVLDFD